MSDFGVSILGDEKGSIEQPFYIKKDVYDVGSETSYDKPFDMRCNTIMLLLKSGRLFGIVLAKMLLCGEDIESEDLLDYKTQLITRTIPCSHSPYMDLLDL